MHSKPFCTYSWASGALDPESSASNDIVTSVKRCAYFEKFVLIHTYIMILTYKLYYLSIYIAELFSLNVHY